jgi:DNA-binding LacI/PurR family transcriptional regulator
MPLSVLLEAKRFISEAAAALAKSGCHRVIQLCASKEQEASRRDLLPALVGSSYEGGAEIAKKLLLTPKRQRPDGIVSDDDTIVSGLLAELLTTQGPTISYLPEIATIVHKELGEHYPSRKMLLFEQNIEEYALIAVELLIRVLRGLESPKKKLQYRFVCLES